MTNEILWNYFFDLLKLFLMLKHTCWTVHTKTEDIRVCLCVLGWYFCGPLYIILFKMCKYRDNLVILVITVTQWEYNTNCLLWSIVLNEKSKELLPEISHKNGECVRLQFTLAFSCDEHFPHYPWLQCITNPFRYYNILQASIILILYSMESFHYAVPVIILCPAWRLWSIKQKTLKHWRRDG